MSIVYNRFGTFLKDSGEILLLEMFCAKDVCMFAETEVEMLESYV
jgi:hypothetical protein